MSVLALQKALKAAGHDPGPIDGALGPKTRAAIRSFQGANGLVVDGIVGPKTGAKLFGDEFKSQKADKSVPLDMPWLIEASRQVGVKEGVGTADNKIIMDWAEHLDASYASDEVPWCGLFVAHCIASTLPDDPIPVNFLGARQWNKFGKSVTPQMGSVLVFWRGSRDGWKGHVGFYWGEDDDTYHVLGGNQSNSVNVTRLTKGRLLDARWPNSVAPRGIRRMASSNGMLISVNEQ